MNKYQSVDLSEVDIKERTQHIPTALFNSMIHPLIPYTIKGALWYQGESNRKASKKYMDFFPAMVKDWRDRWGIGDFPFYYVQIAPYTYGWNKDGGIEQEPYAAMMREAQLKCLDLIPNSGIAITMDLGSEFSIHPPKKKEVADRLLFNALHQTYGYTNIDYTGPTFDSMSVEQDGSVLVTFKNAEKGLYTFDGLSGFEIAGADKVFYPAKAEIVYKKYIVKLSSEKVPKPVAVRYGWSNWIDGTLFDTNLLPASSFRTDDWEEATSGKE